MGKRGRPKSRQYSDRVYHAWYDMVRRCTDPKCPNFQWYGARGIAVCERWKTFANFYADMGEPNGLYLDRLDNDGNYEPGNCRWVTLKESLRNRRNTCLVTHGGRTQTIAAWAEETGVRSGLIYARLRLGWPAEKAITTPCNAFAVRKQRMAAGLCAVCGARPIADGNLRRCVPCRQEYREACRERVRQRRHEKIARGGKSVRSYSGGRPRLSPEVAGTGRPRKESRP